MLYVGESCLKVGRVRAFKESEVERLTAESKKMTSSDVSLPSGIRSRLVTAHDDQSPVNEYQDSKVCP